MSQLSKFATACFSAVGAVVTVVLLSKAIREIQFRGSVRDFLNKLQSSFSMSRDRLLDISESLKEELTAGLLGKSGSCLKMLPSYVDNLPDGSEVGVFYALDLGGTNFRVMRVMLKGKEGGVHKTEFEGGVITPECMTGTPEQLFDMMAKKLAAFIQTEGEEWKPRHGHHRELGFTFSFPCDQTAINGGKLIRWTKGFNIPAMEGADVVRILEESLERQGVDVKVTALVNDAVGTLAGARYKEPEVVLAVILGTGTNACYEESEHMSHKLIGPPPASGHMVINTEWGNFNSSLLPITEYDRKVDKKSPNWGQQQTEKLVSGMYLGEIMRLALVDLQQSVGFFETPCDALFKEFTLGTPDASKMHADESSDLKTVGTILEKSFGVKSTLYQRKIVKEVVGIVTKRGAELSAALMLGVLKKVNREKGGRKTVIAVDGGLYENYTQFRVTLEKTLNDLLGEASESLSMVLSKDGSGIGSALLAASHSLYKWRTNSTGSNIPKSYSGAAAGNGGGN